MDKMLRGVSVLLCATACGSMLGLSVPAIADGTIASDDDSLKSDHVVLFTNWYGIEKESDPEDKDYCAPKGSKVVVSDVDETSLYLRFFSVPTNPPDPKKSDKPAGSENSDKPEKANEPTLTDILGLTDSRSNKEAIAACTKPVNTYTTYKISRATIKHDDFRRSGVAFGALVVPFKFRLGNSKELVSSSTVAPFIGFRTGWFPFGLSVTPVVAAGLSIVPITDPASGNTESKTAYTIAGGFRLTSSKNEKFNAGLLFGHDFVNKSDRGNDQNVSKPWLSFYVGYSM